MPSFSLAALPLPSCPKDTCRTPLVGVLTVNRMADIQSLKPLYQDIHSERVPRARYPVSAPGEMLYTMRNDSTTDIPVYVDATSSGVWWVTTISGAVHVWDMDAMTIARARSCTEMR